jgi:CDP-paratose 2-epimerase
MAIALVTGSAGLIGSEACRFLAAQKFNIIGIDNDMRKFFFGEEASTEWNRHKLENEIPGYVHYNIDIRDKEAVEEVFAKYGQDIKLIIHTAAQPSHDWAAKDAFTDFTVNANGTLVMLEMARKYCPESVFIFTSTNKVYGDTPNRLPLVELEKRWEVSPEHQYAKHGIDESMSIDATKHSLFGASKVAADVLVQEYGRYFGMKTGVFRGGCLTGPSHSGTQLHGFLAYLVKCTLEEKHYTVFGYKGKQVRDNIHSYDLVNAFWHFYQNPRPGEVYNMGGSRHSNCSMLEAIDMIEKMTGKKLNWSYQETNRIGDHIWWISDVSKFQAHYPDWKYKYTMEDILGQMIQGIGSRI